MDKYPYIQNKTRITDFICEDCKQLNDKGFNVEWRVDIFQGNCEFEKTCESCLSKQLNKIKVADERQAKFEAEREAKYEARLKPKWDILEALFEENDIEVTKYPNTGQWTLSSLNHTIDWWTTTGTAINRKTRKEYYFTVEKPDKIIKALNQPQTEV